MTTEETGIVLSLALDAVDPRLSADARNEACATALDMDPVVAGAILSALLYAILESIRDVNGPAALDEAMRMLGVMTMAAAEAEALEG